MAIVHDYQRRISSLLTALSSKECFRDLACAKVRGGGSTAHRGSRRSREQPLVCGIARSGRAPRSPAPRRLRSHLARWPIASSVARLGRGRASQSRQRRRGASGHGVVLWFQVDDFDAVVERARRLGAEIIEEPHFNPAPQHREIWLRDPDGYVLVVASPDGESSSQRSPLQC